MCVCVHIYVYVYVVCVCYICVRVRGVCVCVRARVCIYVLIRVGCCNTLIIHLCVGISKCEEYFGCLTSIGEVYVTGWRRFQKIQQLGCAQNHAQALLVDRQPSTVDSGTRTVDWRLQLQLTESETVLVCRQLY